MTGKFLKDYLGVLASNPDDALDKTRANFKTGDLIDCVYLDERIASFEWQENNKTYHAILPHFVVEYGKEIKVFEII